MPNQLTERRQKLLQIIVDEYVTSAQPVGSNALVEKYRLPYSSATVRNEMARSRTKGTSPSRTRRRGAFPRTPATATTSRR